MPSLRTLATVAALAVWMPLAASGSSIIFNSSPAVTFCDPSCALPELTSGIGQDIFSLVSTATLTEIRFWTFEAAGAYGGGNISWQIADVHGTILGGATLAPARSALGAISFYGIDLDEYEYDLTLGSALAFNLSTPQQYSLTLRDLSALDHYGIFWAPSGPSTLAFQLIGSGNADPAPEPSSWWLVCTGVLWGGVRFWRLRTSR